MNRVLRNIIIVKKKIFPTNTSKNFKHNTNMPQNIKKIAQTNAFTQKTEKRLKSSKRKKLFLMK